MNKEAFQHEKLVSLSAHFSTIAEFLFIDVSDDGLKGDTEESSHDSVWESVATPLMISASIEEIKTTVDVLDSGAYMCGTAWDYEVAKSELYSCYIKGITLFMWAWIAFEKLVDLLCGEKINGRTERAINFLKRDGSATQLSSLHEISHLAFDLAPNLVKERTLSAVKKKKEIEFAHVHLCREARNELFHAHHASLVPGDWGKNSKYNPEKDESVLYINMLSRLALLSIQSILFVHLKDSSCLTDGEFSSRNIPRNIPVAEAIRILHLKNDDEQKGYIFEADDFDETYDANGQAKLNL